MTRRGNKTLAARLTAIFMAMMMVFSLMPSALAYAEPDSGNSEGNIYDVTINVIPKEANVEFFSGEDAETALSPDQVKDNGIVNGVHQYVISVAKGRYSYRGTEESTDLGGMCFDVPFDEEILYDPETGGGVASGRGLELTLLRTNLYTNSSKIVNKGDYTVNAIPAGLPAAVPGTQFLDTENRVVTPMMIVARGNALVYQINIDINGEMSDTYAVEQLANVTFSESLKSTLPTVFSVNSTVYHTITAPEGAKAQVFEQLNNFNVKEIPVKSTEVNSDGTVTSKFATRGGGNLTYRVSSEGKITRAGYFGAGAESIVVTYDSDENPKTTENKTALQERMESSTLVNVNSQNNLKLEVDETFRLRSYRAAWQIINTDTMTIMIEPDFDYEIVSGGEHIEMTPVTDRCTGNAGTGDSANWMDIKGVSEGTAIIEVSYDAIIIGGKGTSNDGLYGATNVQRKSLVVINVGESANILKMRAKNGADYWDTEYDTLYFVEDTGTLEFTATLGEDTPDKVELSTDRGETWKAVNEENGNYIADGLVPGNNILKFTKGSTVEYQVVRGAQVTYTVENLSHDFENLNMVGDKIRIKFDGLFVPVPKFSGIYNPGFGSGHDIVYRDAEGCSQSAEGGQYSFITDHELIVTPEKEGKLVLDDGCIKVSVMGKLESKGHHRTLPDSGCGVNMSATGCGFECSILPTITIDVTEKKEVPVTINTNVENSNISITDGSGKEILPDDSGVYSLVYGEYSYVITSKGYARQEGSFMVHPEDGESKTIDFELVKLEDNVWDGFSKEEAPLVDGVYQIATSAQLAWFADQVNEGTGAAWNAVLLDDLSLGTENPWTPMMDYTGTFDGNGHYISDLYICVKGAENQGLFGRIKEGAVIKNLGLDGDITVEYAGRPCSYTGGITADAGEGTVIENCVNRVNVTGSAHVGGIAGRLCNNSSIVNCYNTGNISGDTYVGGITGLQYFKSGERKAFTFRNCYNTGMVNGSTRAGAICYESNGTIAKNSYFLENTCNVTLFEGGKKVTSDELKSSAPTLGEAYMTSPSKYNDGYPILIWEEEKAQPTVQERFDKIAALEEITLDDRELIEAARAAYDALSDEEKAEITGYEAFAEKEELMKVLVAKAEAKNMKATVKVKSLSTSRVQASWNKVQNADNYKVVVKRNGSSVKTVNVSGTKYTYSSCKSGYAYTMTVTPAATIKGEKISGKSSSATVIIKPTKPSITAKVKKSNVNIKASKRVCTGYQIQICKNRKFNSGVKKYTVKSTTLNKNIKLSSLKKGKNYIRVRAYKTYNGKTVYGNWSKIKSVKR